MHKILVIDDEKDITDTVSEMVETRFSSGIDKAYNGLDAFLLATKNQYDLIITDHKMPFMTGAAFIIATRTKEESQNKNTPIIMLSGFLDDQVKSNLKLHNIQFLTKPFKPNDIFEMIRDHLI